MMKILIALNLFVVVVYSACDYDVFMAQREEENNAGPIEQTRLNGLGGEHYGRVEVLIDGEWGTICDDGWDNNDAKVVCRSLGMTGGIAYKRAWFGQGTGNITMTSVNCKGDELSLRNCSYKNENCCSHREDAAVYCDKPQ